MNCEVWLGKDKLISFRSIATRPYSLGGILLKDKQFSEKANK